MIFFQVEDIDAAFKELAEREANGWATVAKVASKPAKKAGKAPVPKIRKVKSPAKPKSKPTSSLRELMAAKRKAMMGGKSPAASDAGSAAAAAPSSPSSTLDAVAKATLDPEKVFEGGFFNVRSPLRAVSASVLNKSSSGLAVTPRSNAKSGGGARSASSALKIARVTRATRASMLNFDAADNNEN